MPYVSQICKKLNVPPAYIIFPVLLFLLLIILFGFAGSFVTRIIAVGYPAFKSIQALETKSDPDDDKYWLTYWLVYGLFVFADEMAGFILEIIPLYHFGKVCFLIWLFNPATKGASVVYKQALKPLLKAN